MVASPHKYIRHAVREWTVLLVLLALAAAFLTLTPAGLRSLQSLTWVLYDTSVSRLSTGASQVTVVAIDEASIAQMGRWPWRRAVHAALLDKIRVQQPAVVGLDILFSEATEDDAILAEAIRRLPAVVLAAESMEMASGRRVALLPSDTLITPEARIGHVGVLLDADSIVRSIAMSEGATPALPLQLAQLYAQQKGRSLPGEFAHLLSKTTKAEQSAQFERGLWTSEMPLALPFGQGQPSPTIVSYGAVLRGEVDASAFRDRIVLIGATATGLGDLHATPRGSSMQAGVLLHANAVTTIQQRLYVRNAKPWISFAFTLFMLCTVMAGIFKLSAGRALLWVLAVAALAYCTSAILLWRERTWIDCAASIVLCGLAYPLWSWRRLQAAVTGLAQEASAIAHLPAPWPRPPVPSVPPLALSADPLGKRLTLLADASAQLRIANRFYANTLNAQAHPVVVVAENHRVMFANAAARTAFADSAVASDDMNVSHWSSAAFADLYIPEKLTSRVALERRDRRGRDWLVSIESISGLKSDQSDAARMLVQLVDISVLRSAQRERDEAMRFLSHDIRSPQVSLINWVAQERKNGSIPAKALDAVEMHSRNALEMADAFLRLSRAETQELAREEVSMGILCDEAVDASYSTARQRNIRFEQGHCENDIVLGDAALLRRALMNLIGNAINYGPPDASIKVTVRNNSHSVTVAIADQGTGVTDEDIDRVFKPYYRGSKRHDLTGTGLGLTFVQTVAQRHGGSVRIVPGDAGHPSVFELSLPAAQAY